MKFFYNILFLLVSLNIFGQRKFSIELLTGVGFNQEISLIDENIEDYFAFSTAINANYRFKLINNFFAETGLGVQSYLTYGSIGVSEFNSSTFRLNLPFVINYPVIQKGILGLGVSMANNRDFKDIKFRENYNLRSSLVLKGSYYLNEYYNFIILMKHNLSNIPDLFLVNQPKINITAGVSFKI